MAKPVIVVESPAKAKTIKSYLNNQYDVEATFGHLIDLPTNKLGVDIDNDYAPTYVTIKGKGKVIKRLKNRLKKAPLVLLASDPDREGESIAWQVVRIAGLDKDHYKRIVFHEITQEAIQQAIKKARDLDSGLIEAQQTRRILDRLIGYPLSQLLWKKVRYGLSAGRVQSAALRLIVEREEEIERFKSEKFYIIQSTNTPIVFKIVKHSTLKPYRFTKQETDEILQLFKKDNLVKIEKISEEEIKITPPPPYDTASLQQDANRILGYSAKYTMQIAQQLYQGLSIKGIGQKALITYMRTDSYRLSKQAIKSIRSFITQQYKGVLNEKVREYKTKSKVAQEAHEAIRPIDIFLTPEYLKGKIPSPHLKLYTLIWKRALATQAKPAIRKKIKYIASPLNDKAKKLFDTKSFIFYAEQTALIDPGFLTIYGYKKETISSLYENEHTLNLELEAVEKQTKPPKRYTDATLVKTLKKLGIGRPSTYATILSILPKRNYVEYEGRFIKPTELGKIIVQFLKEYFPKIVDYDFTAKIEDQLDQIANSKTHKVTVIDMIFPEFIKRVKEVEANVDKADLLIIGESNEQCPKCGSPMVIKVGRFGKFLSCSRFPECDGIKPYIDLEKYVIPPEVEKGEYQLKFGPYGPFWAHKDYPKIKKVMPLLLKETCPKCGRHLVERKNKKGRIFIGCSGYPECDFIKPLEI